jgi:protein required for attachment to host cells
MKTTWVLAADESIARILERPQDGSELVPVEELTDPDAHAKESEFHSGPHGRRAGVGGGTQAMVGASESELHQHSQAFASRIAQRLEQFHRERRYDELHVLAAPRLMGYLRKAFEPNLSAAVVNEIDKDLVKESNRELTRRLFPARSGIT